MQFEKIVLPNHLRLITIPLEYTNIVTVLIMVQTGSKYEEKEVKGISHFLEHMFFKGTERYPSPLALASQLDAMGAEYNAFTHKEYTGYWIKAHQKKLDRVLDIISDILQNSLFKKEEIERERKVILEEMKMCQDLPMKYVSDLFEGLLYGDQPAGWSVIGEEKTILQISRKRILDYFRKHYGAQNIIVLIAGRIESKATRRKVEDYFRLVGDKEKTDKVSTQEEQKQPRVSVLSKDTDQTHFILGVRGVDIFSADRYKAALLATLLGGNMSSRLFIEIREKRGLAYYIKAENTMYTDSGYLSIQGGVAHQNLEETIQVILNELKLIKKKGVRESELKKAKEYLKGVLYLNVETSDEIALWMGEQEALKEEIIIPQEVEREIDVINEKDIVDLSQRLFTNQGLNLAVIGPVHKKEEELVKNLVI